jgi:cobalamin-dependent methionine synthase I
MACWPKSCDEGLIPLKARYSAGYGDLALENQRQIHRLLGMELLGVSLTDHSVLVPEKSVTAISGIV